MPPRKRSRQLAFRTGQINAAGGRPIDPRTIKHRTVVASQFIASGTTAGDHMSFRINNFNTPLEMATTTTFANPTNISDDRHPSGHVELVQDAYDTYQVLQTHYRWHVMWCGSNTPTEDYIFAYKFDADAQSTNPAFPADVNTTEVWLDMQASPGWVWKRFTKATNGARELKMGGYINITVDNVYDLIRRLNTGRVQQFEYPADYRGVLADSNAAPVAQAALHICIFSLGVNGIPSAHTADDFLISCRCTQTVLCNKLQDTTEIIDIGDVGP